MGYRRRRSRRPAARARAARSRRYLRRTRSRSQVYMRAMKPPSEAMPLRSPMPSTVVSMWVAPASRAEKALATAQPESLCPWNSMSASVSGAGCPTRRATWVGEAMPTVSAMPRRFDDTQAVDRQVDPEEVGLLAAEGVLGAEAQHDIRRLRSYPGQHIGGQVDDLLDALAVAEADARPTMCR